METVQQCKTSRTAFACSIKVFLFQYSTHTKYYILLILCFVNLVILYPFQGLTFHYFRKYYNIIRKYIALNTIEVWLKMCIICLVFIDYYCFRNGIFKFKFGKVYNRCRNGVCHLYSLICQNFKN